MTDDNIVATQKTIDELANGEWDWPAEKKYEMCEDRYAYSSEWHLVCIQSLTTCHL